MLNEGGAWVAVVDGAAEVAVGVDVAAGAAVLGALAMGGV
jgi:hypothetical protein